MGPDYALATNVFKGFPLQLKTLTWIIVQLAALFKNLC